MKKIAFLFLLASSLCWSQQTTKTISGKIGDGTNPLTKVTVEVENKDTQVFTDAEGNYSLQAEVGDLLSYTLQGMKPIKIRVEDVTRILNPIMVPDIEELDEVVVVGSNRKSQKDLAYEYPVNKNLIKTAYGIVDAETAAGNVRFLHEDQINPIGLCILNVLRNRFSGVFVSGDCFNGGSISLRGGGSINNQRTAIYDVDGNIFTDTPIWLDINNIKRIAVFNNLATTTRYGYLGAGGVIVINTLASFPGGQSNGRSCQA